MTATTSVISSADSPAAEYRRHGWWRQETFLDDLRLQARTRPRKLAVVGRRLDEARTDTLDYAELERLTDRFAGALLALNVQRGDVVAVQLPNTWEMAPLIFACIAVGAVLCPIVPSCRDEELRHRLELTEARICITVAESDGYQLAEEIVAMRRELPLEHVVVLGGRAPERRDRVPRALQLRALGGAARAGARGPRARPGRAVRDPLHLRDDRIRQGRGAQSEHCVLGRARLCGRLPAA